MRIAPRRDYPVTPTTIALAKAQQQAERQELERLTGVKIEDDGTVRLPARSYSG